MLGLQYNEFLGTLHFWTFFVGVNLTFFPMHFLGLAGVFRRVPDYPDAFSGWNRLAPVGSFVSFLSACFFFYLVVDLVGGGCWITYPAPLLVLDSV